MRIGYVQQTAIILGVVWWALFTFGALTFGGLHDTSITGFFFLIILVGVVAGWRPLLSFSILAGLSLVGIYFAEQQGVLQPIIYIPSDAADLAMPLVLIVASTFVLRIAISYLRDAHDRAQYNAGRLEEINAELQTSQNHLAQRTQELERRANYLEATATVAHDVASELDPDLLLDRIVNLVTKQFDFYHTGLFLIEAGREYATLRAASSEGGQHMLARGHSLRVGEEGIVGFVASQGLSRVALDTGADAVYFDNPYLPDTRSEAALPLLIRGQTIGVLDVQSVRPEAFSKDDIAVLQTMADQISLALQNAQLFQQVEESLEMQRRAYGDASKDAWERLAKERDAIGYHFIQGEVAPLKGSQIPKRNSLPEITIPIELGNQIIGHITAHKGTYLDLWSSDEIVVMETLSHQLSVALESARLYQETQLRAARERLTGEITSRIRETLDLEFVIQTAAREFRDALNLAEVEIRLGYDLDESNQLLED